MTLFCRNYKIISRLAVIALLVTLASVSIAQAQEPQTLGTLKLHSAHFKVSDVDRSLKFYQDLLGMPIQGRIGDTLFLRIGAGPQFIALSPVDKGETPHIAAIGLSAANFEPAQITGKLDTLGYHQVKQKSEPTETALADAKTYWETRQGLYFVDQEGVHFQITNSQYCGGGEDQTLQCNDVEALKNVGKFNLLDINHFTTFVANSKRANEFYMDLLGLDILSYQGPTTPSISIGDGRQFLMFVGGSQSGPPSNAARIHHLSMSLEGFNVDAIFDTLKAYGLKARASGDNSTPPLIYYVSQRMPNRGGAEGGTPEVYFTDPDGILLQVQDPSYCGGGGYLGDKC